MMTRFELRLFGSFQLEINRKPATSFRSDKVRALLAYLALDSDRVHRREALAALLWPQSDESAARASLRISLSNLRKLLGSLQEDNEDGPLLRISRHSVELNSQHPEFWLDVQRFDAWLEACRLHPHEQMHRCLICAPRLAQALELYEGDFLAGLTLADAPTFDEWRVLQQEKYHQKALGALETLVQHHLALANYEQAQRYARREVALAQWNEGAHRDLMRALALAGKKAEALAQFKACRRLLAEEMGVEPTAETVALAEQIGAGQLQKVAVGPAVGTEKSDGARVSAPAHNLPPQTTPFFGRQAEIAEVQRLLLDPAYRLVTIVGPGGVGKTRLALAVATRIQRRFPQGAWFVPLSGVDAPQSEPSTQAAAAESTLATAVANALDLTFQGDADPQVQITNYLRDKELLLIMDNFEHLLAGAGFLTMILNAAPAVSLLVTSRQRLNLKAEHGLSVKGLTLPEVGSNLERAAEVESVQLFVERANRTPAGFELTAENAPHVSAVCRLVDGLPLAIELAATWTAHYTSAEIAQAIRENVDFLSTQMRDVPQRHRSLRAVFEQSWQLLPEREQRALALASVFSGPFTREAAGVVTGASLMELAAIVDKSLLRAGSGRWYELHPLLRQFAREKRDRFAAECREAQTRHTHHYLNLLQDQEAALDTTAAPQTLRFLRRNLPNIRQAWFSAVAFAELSLLQESVDALGAFLVRAGLWQEGVRTFSTSLAQLKDEMVNDAEDSLLRTLQAHLMNQRARFAYILADYDRGLALARSALEQVPQSGPVAVLANAHLEIGRALEGKTNYEAAKGHLQKALSLSQTEGLSSVQINSLRTLGHVYMFEGDYVAARRHYQAGLDVARERGHLTSEAHMLINVGNVAYLEGDFESARRKLEQASELARQLGDRRVESTTVGNLGRILLDQGDFTAAKEAIERALAYRDEMGDSYGVAILRNSLGDIALNYGEYEHARALFQQCVVLHRQTGNRQATSHTLCNVALATHLLGNHSQAEAVCREALALARDVGAASEQGDALTRLGHILAAQERLAEAEDAYAEALNVRRELGQPNRALEPLAGIARLALSQDQPRAALEKVEKILAYVDDEGDLSGVVQPFLVYLTCYRVLQANDDRRADGVLDSAYSSLQERAARISDETHRHSFLQAVTSHRHIVEAWQAARA